MKNNLSSPLFITFSYLVSEFLINILIIVFFFCFSILNLIFVVMYRELGIGIVPYSPLGRGFFAGKAVVENLPENSSLVSTLSLDL